MIGKIEYLYDIRSIARNEYLKLCSEYREIVKNVSLEKKFPYEEFLQKKIEEYKNHYEFIDEYTYIDAFPINKYMDIKNLPQLKKQNRAKYREVDESLLRNYHNKIIEKYGASYAVETKRYFENKLNELNKNKYIDLAAEKSDKEKEFINAKYIVKANNITRIIDALNKHIETLQNHKLNKSIEKI